MAAEATDDPVFTQFLNDADLKTPARAAVELRRYGVPDATVDELLEKYERHVGRINDVRAVQFMHAGGRLTWYGGPRPTDPTWWPFLDDLKVKRFEADALDKIDEASSRVVGLLDHPALPDFHTKGLVVGHVQSGKTTNYTGVIAKAVDRGYRLVIVLAGIHNELRRQTQTRLKSQLVDLNPELWHQLTDPDEDFRPKANAPAYFARYSSQKVLCVVKKNAIVLRRLIGWLEDARDQLALTPVLIIDDEADQAAVATRTINPLILELLTVLPKAAYVGYTASPFANLLIDPSSRNLYPEDFIVDLPKPASHFGTESIFGREPLDGEDPADYDDEAYDMVRIVPDDEVGHVRPGSRAEVDGFAPSVAGQLRRAVLYFWLATAARRVRGTGNPHSTMLVHTSVRVPVHESFRAPLEALRSATGDKIDEGDVVELEQIWAEETPRVPATTFDEVPVLFEELRRHLGAVVADTRIVCDNSASKDRLDYGGAPVTAIAIGGNTLSRGLTLEGLVVSYFVRAATAYDTLLQMGRWFGYRDGYADLPRVWMTDELRDWFRHLAGVEAEIRRDIAHYMSSGETPMQFAVRIKAHPALKITAAAKMQDAVRVASSFGGMRVQTRYFRADDFDWLTSNQVAAQKLVAAIGGAGTCESKDAKRLVWREVDASHVETFLDAYQVHEKAADKQSGALKDYIVRRRKKGKLDRWNVVIVGSARARRGNFDFGAGVVVPRVIRARIPESPSSAADIKTLMSMRDAAIDLAVEPERKLAESIIRELRVEQAPETGLLVLYAIDAQSPPTRSDRKALDAVADVIGVGMVFPQPPADTDDATYYAADLSEVGPSNDGYVEHDDPDDVEGQEA